MRSPRPSWPITLLLAVAVGSGQARGQEKSWVSVGIGGGGGIFVPASSPHDPNLMFCASDMSGAYRSTDGGRTWRMLNWRQISSAIVCPAVFHPTDPNVMYWISGPWAGPVLRVSRDKGLTWKPVTDQMPWRHGTPQSTLVGLGPRGEVLLVSADNGTFRSDDQGKTWTRAAGIEKRVIAFFFEPPKLGNFWYAATPGGVLCSADRGRTWAPCPGKSPGRPIGAFCGGADETTGEVVLYCAVPSQEDKGRFSGGIFRSDDRGSTWKSAMGSGLNTTIGRHGPVRSTIASLPGQ